MRRIVLVLICSVLSVAACAEAETGSKRGQRGPDEFAAMRVQLIETIREQAQAAAQVTGVARFDDPVLEAMGAVPRHEFVPKPLRMFSYLDSPLPLGHGQNISQPFLVALMTHLAGVRKSDIVFETGTGAGYQAAILSRLARKVYSVEVVESLARSAAERLKRLGYANVEVKAADGFYGWPEKGPFDAIIVKEAVQYIPPPLLNQLKPGGRLVVPVGPLDRSQVLKLVTKDGAGRLKHRDILPVRFAPLQGGDRI